MYIGFIAFTVSVAYVYVSYIFDYRNDFIPIIIVLSAILIYFGALKGF